MDNEFIAHVRRDEKSVRWITQGLAEHLRGTAELSRGFADAFGAGEYK